MNENIKAGSDIHAGDGGYSLGTQEAHDEFVKGRNKSLVRTKLRELERASGLEIYGLGAKRDKWEATIERMAKLIIEECAVELSNVPGGTDSSLYYDNVKRLKRHFGFEE